ncbi:MAG TPA: phosphoribosyl-ATP diphosphatase [Candidatus Limnocylindrales bacterium]|nr:phosphoribosyl-ATP diphosphatase [Candidatus Limnocylindrales bacterium]
MADFLVELEAIVAERQRAPHPGSYTSSLFADGAPCIAQKVGEEAVEVVVAALAQSRERQIEETADLVFHLLVLLAAEGITLDDVRAELERRHR